MIYKVNYLHNDGRECVDDPDYPGGWLVDIVGEQGGVSGEACLRAHELLSDVQFTTVTDLRDCKVQIEQVYRKLWAHKLVPFANADGGICTCKGFSLHKPADDDEGRSLWYVHLAVAVGGCTS